MRLPSALRCAVFLLTASLLGPTALVLGAADGQANAAGTAPLRRINTGHFVVEAVAGGHPLRMVVDTACPVTVIEQSSYRRLGLPEAARGLPEGVRPLQSLNGRSTGTGYLPGLEIGGAALGGSRVAVAGLEAVLGSQFAGGGGADGILGTDALAHHGATLDLVRGTLSLATTHASRAAVARRAAQDGYVAIPLVPTSGGHLAVACIIRDDPGRLVVDTGSPYTVVQRATVAPEAFARPGRVLLMRGLAGATPVAWVELERWSIGAFPVTRASVGAGDFHGGLFAERTRSGGQVVGLLGLEWLAHWGAIIDFGSRTLYLRHP